MEFHPHLLPAVNESPPQWHDYSPELVVQSIKDALSSTEISVGTDTEKLSLMCLRCWRTAPGGRHSRPRTGPDREDLTPQGCARDIAARFTTPIRYDELRVVICPRHTAHPATQAEMDWIQAYNKHLLLTMMYRCADEYRSVLATFLTNSANFTAEHHRRVEHNMSAENVSKVLRADNWRDVVSAYRQGIRMSLDKYVHDGQVILPFLVRLTLHLLTPHSHITARTLMEVERQVSVVEEALTNEPDLPWELAAAWAGIDEQRVRTLPEWVRSGRFLASGSARSPRVLE